MTLDADVLVVGGGIAGCAAAFHAARAGRHVTLVDEGLHRASDLPVALINPLRGATGRLVTGGVDGMHAAFALIDSLVAAGHAVQSRRGLFRPLIDVPVHALDRAFWAQALGDRLAFDWHPSAPRALGLAVDVPALFLRDAGWVAAPTLLDALNEASGATCIAGRVTGVTADAGNRGVATLADGTTIVARSLLWCGGAWGAALLDRAAHHEGQTGDALYKPGSLLAVEASLTEGAMSFGLYVAPWRTPGRAATLIGPTREGSQPVFPVDAMPAGAIDHLADRVARLFGPTPPLCEAWRGVRLARLSTTATAALAGIPTLTALGSRGFLMAPLLAESWARSL